MGACLGKSRKSAKKIGQQNAAYTDADPAADAAQAPPPEELPADVDVNEEADQSVTTKSDQSAVSDDILAESASVVGAHQNPSSVVDVVAFSVLQQHQNNQPEVIERILNSPEKCYRI